MFSSNTHETGYSRKYGNDSTIAETFPSYPPEVEPAQLAGLGNLACNAPEEPAAETPES